MGLTFPLDESNPDPRVACIVLADVSGSMMGEPIEALEKGFTQFVEYIQAPGLARKRAEVGVITFGSTADVVLPLRGAQELEPIRFTAGGSTNMAAAIHLGLDMIEERKAEYKASGIRYYRPWLLVLTDGEPNSAGFDEAVARLNQVEVAKGVTVFAVGVGEMANFTMLERLSRDRKPAPLAGLKFEEFFQWLSDSLSGMSSSGNHGSSDSEVASNSTEQVPLPSDRRVGDRLSTVFNSDGSADRVDAAVSSTEVGETAVQVRWSVCGASVPGTKHLEKNQGCDDAFGYATVGDMVVLAVADGAGSVTGKSAWGSYTAVNQVLDDVTAPWFEDMLSDVRTGEVTPQGLLEWLFRSALETLRRRVAYTGQPLSDLATTLAVAIATPDLTMCAQIGDGIIALKTPAGIETVLIEEKTEYENWTWFLQSDRAFSESFRSYASTGATALALSTDGMSYKITNVATGAAFVPFFEEAWTAVAEGLNHQQFAAWLAGIENDQTGDDKTIVLAQRVEVPASAEPELEVKVQSHRPPRWPRMRS